MTRILSIMVNRMSRHRRCSRDGLARQRTVSAFAIAATSSLLDLDAVILAAGLPDDRTAELVSLTATALDGYNTKGVHLPELRQAEIGITARAMGGAFLPIYANFSSERDALLINV